MLTNAQFKWTDGGQAEVSRAAVRAAAAKAYAAQLSLHDSGFVHLPHAAYDGGCLFARVLEMW
eukprot:COSAG01_NODE_4002_length_5442_cov_23.955830_1_plen_63_part_00